MFFAVRFNALLVVIHRSLKALIRAVKGEIVMSLPLEEAYDAIISQRVPAEWKVGLTIAVSTSP